MNRLILTTMLLCLSGMIWAQETAETEIKMTVGDTVVWQPFDNCDAIGYNISGPKIIHFQYLHWGEKIEIVAKQAGSSSISAKLGR